MMTTLMSDSFDHRNNPRLVELAREVADLRLSVAAEGRRMFQGWRGDIERPAFGASALNLAHYLALRQVLARMDTRDLEASLGKAQAQLRQAQRSLDKAKADFARS